MTRGRNDTVTQRAKQKSEQNNVTACVCAFLPSPQLLVHIFFDVVLADFPSNACPHATKLGIILPLYIAAVKPPSSPQGGCTLNMLSRCCSKVGHPLFDIRVAVGSCTFPAHSAQVTTQILIDCVCIFPRPWLREDPPETWNFSGQDISSASSVSK